MHLLLAEDDGISQAFLVEVLTSSGHQVDCADDGPAALALARSQPFDRLLLDLNLPRLRGDEVLAKLRCSVGASAASPALALTADDDPRRHRQLLAAGFDAVIGKPVSRATLLRHVDGRVVAADGTTRPLCDGPAAVLDETAALAAAAGDPAIVSALRGLLRQELPAQRQRIASAIALGQLETVHGELHRLRASCGFCGANGLALAARRLEQALDDGVPSPEELWRFSKACDALLGVLAADQGSPVRSG